MRHRSQQGSSTPALLLLLAVLVGGAAWNFQRNVAAEEAEYRPFRGYSDADLDQLAGAYESKQKTDRARFDATADLRARAADQAYFDQQVREFERAQRVGAARKRTRDALAESKTTLKLVEEERRRRAEESNRVLYYLSRIFSIPS